MLKAFYRNNIGSVVHKAVSEAALYWMTLDVFNAMTVAGSGAPITHSCGLCMASSKSVGSA